MLRFLVLAAVALFVYAHFTNARALRRALYVAAGLAVAYTILKAAGVVEAIAPDRHGAWGILIPMLQTTDLARIILDPGD